MHPVKITLLTFKNGTENVSSPFLTKFPHKNCTLFGYSFQQRNNHSEDLPLAPLHFYIHLFSEIDNQVNSVYNIFITIVRYKGDLK